MQQDKEEDLLGVRASKREDKGMREELLPCPFCGGEPFLEKKHRAIIDKQPTRVCYVRCTQCGARQGWIDVRDYGKTSSSYEAVLKAVENWNMRYGEW